MKIFQKKAYRITLFLAPIVIIILFIIQFVILHHFNSQKNIIEGLDESREAYIDIQNRQDSTSSWLKRDFQLGDRTVDLNGKTVDAILYNNSDNEINKWGLQINIKGDCYINNAWCGTVEIHQNTGKDTEKVQTLDLRNYSLTDVALEYTYDGDLLIPLQEGDYIIYYPSEKDDELPLAKNSQLTIGFIFYYLEDLDLSDFTFQYNYHRTIWQGTLFYIILALFIFWIINISVYISSVKIYEDAQKELELKKSGISCMSSMYNTIYIVDLVKNEIVSVVAEEISNLKRPEDLPANEQLRTLFEIDSTVAFRESVLEFVDLTTLRDRMKDRNNVAFEYISQNRGWSRLRFFAMDYAKDKPVDRVVFTIQVIDNEKREMDAIEKKVLQAEAENKELSTFFDILSKELLIPTRQTIEMDMAIISESGEEKIREYAAKSKQLTHRQLKVLEDIIDYSDLEKGNLQINDTDYNFREVLDEVKEYLKLSFDDEQAQFSEDIVQPIPDRLHGAGDTLKDVLQTLLFYALESMEKDSVKLSVFSKRQENRIHMLISVKGRGSKAFFKSRLFRRKLVDGLLKLMGSDLHIIENDDGEEETYFEIDQLVRQNEC
ncbi:MAG: hypothetical protein K5989_02010 [Lachnospiraceae bacterium]|nr:hypothetical protein [Lachnospiraceae bacterium]